MWLLKFECNIMKFTNFQISLKCTAFSGVTIDMVQMQNRDKFEYGMFNMTKQRSYIAADFYSLFDFEKNKELLVSDI